MLAIKLPKEGLETELELQWQEHGIGRISDDRPDIGRRNAPREFIEKWEEPLAEYENRWADS